MQIKKMDRQPATTGAEESKKSESGSKPKISKGIAESESKFETPKSSLLFSSSRYSTPPTTTISDGTSNTIVVGEQSTPPPKTPRPQDGTHQQSRTTTITDGSSNTIMVGEQSPESSAPQASTPESSTNPPIVVVGSGNENVTSTGGSPESAPEFSTQDQQTPVTTKDGSQVSSGGESQQGSIVTIGDGSSNTIVPEEDSTESTEQQTNITDGTSNTIVFGEQSPESAPEFSTQDQQTPVTTKDGSQVSSGGESQQGSTVTIGDGSSNTIVPEEDSTQSTSEASVDSTNTTS